MTQATQPANDDGDQSTPDNIGKWVDFGGDVWKIVAINYLGDYDLARFEMREDGRFKIGTSCRLGLIKFNPHYAVLVDDEWMSREIGSLRRRLCAAPTPAEASGKPAPQSIDATIERGLSGVELPNAEGHWTRFYDNEPASDAPAYWSVLVRNIGGGRLHYSGWRCVDPISGFVDESNLPKGGWHRALSASSAQGEIERLHATVANAKLIMQRVRQVCRIKTNQHMSYSGERYERMMDEFLKQPGGERLIERLKETEAKVTPELNYWVLMAQEREAQLATANATIAAMTEQLDVYKKWKLSIEDSGDTDGWADALKAREQVAALQKRVEELEAALLAIRPLFDSHGPVTGSPEWQAAWKKANSQLKETAVKT